MKHDRETTLETVGKMRIRHRDEFVALLTQAAAWGAETGSNSSETARKIGVSPGYFSRECIKYGVDRPVAKTGRPRKVRGGGA